MAKNKKPFHFFSQMNLAVFIAFLAIAYFTHLSHIVTAGVSDGVRPFSWIGISIFILAISVSEVLISPVMMSSISLLAPVKYKTIFQAFYLTVIGATGLLASKIGAISLQHPFQTFFTLSSVTFVALIFYSILRKKMVGIANEAAEETQMTNLKENNLSKELTN